MGDRKAITQTQFMNYFGELQQFLREDFPNKDGLFLTSVSISDTDNKDEVRVSFEGVYGPIAMFSSPDDLSVSLSDFDFWFVYGKDGRFKDWSGDVPVVIGDLTPSNCPTPSSDLLPHWESSDENDGYVLINVVLRLLEKLRSFSYPLRSISFSVLEQVEYDYQFSPGCSPSWDDPGEAPDFSFYVSGVSLVEDLLESFRYSYSLHKSKQVSGEYDLHLYVSNPKAKERSLWMQYNH